MPLASSLTITDTTFFSSISNFTIFVDSITLDEQITTNQTIEFFNLTSEGSNFTNTNATFDARADFFGLDIGLTIRNINTSTNLFTSASGSQAFNATFTSGQVLRIIIIPPTAAQTACNTMIAQFGTFPVLIGLLGTIILLGAVIFALVTGFVTIKSGGINKGLVFGGILTVVSVAVLVIVAIVIFASLCILL